MDALSDVLTLMRLRGCVYFLRNFSAPWGMQMEDGPFAQFHMVARGRCWLGYDGATTELSTGDVVVFPRGEAHLLLNPSDAVPIPGVEVLQAHLDGQPFFADGGDRTRLLCGHFEFDRTFKHPLAAELPDVIHIKGLTADQPSWFEETSNLLIRESDAEHPGASTVVARLAEVLFIQVLRAYLLQHRPTQGFFAAFNDSQICRALKAIHAGTAADLTLADIAREAGMSRSNLARRFKDVLGKTPMSYLTGWRMLRAQALLQDTSLSLSDIAERVGYKSESAFSHAFKRQFGRYPGTFRRLTAAEG